MTKATDDERPALGCDLDHADSQFTAGEEAIRFEIARAGGGDDVSGSGGGGASPFQRRPAGAREVVAQRLLVEAGLACPGRVAIGGPEARESGVSTSSISSRVPSVAAELELGIGDDDPPAGGVIATGAVHRRS